jgi:hypothetical protein
MRQSRKADSEERPYLKPEEVAKIIAEAKEPYKTTFALAWAIGRDPSYNVVYMTHPKLRIINTELDNLVSNLRGEVGEIITTWTVLRYLMAEERRLSSGGVAADLKDQNLIFLSLLRQKMQDEIVARLSELSTPKIGRLTFHFASAKLNALQTEEDSFRRFIQREKFEEK